MEQICMIEYDSISGAGTATVVAGGAAYCLASARPLRHRKLPHFLSLGHWLWEDMDLVVI